MANRMEALKGPILVVTFLVSNTAYAFVLKWVVAAFGIDIKLEPDNRGFYVVIATGIAISMAAMYVVGNLIEGDTARVRLVAPTLGLVALVVVGVWGGSNFVASTPAWALVVIVLLVLILLKK